MQTYRTLLRRRLRLPRLFLTLLLALALAALAHHWNGRLNDGLLSVTVYKLSLVYLAGVVGYWIDRELFPYARPDGLLGQFLNASHQTTAQGYLQGLALAFGLAQLRRALIVGAAMLAVGMGA